MVTAASSSTVEQLAQLMFRKHVGAVVIEREGVIAGIVTDRDLVCRALADGQLRPNLTAHDVMTSPPVTIGVRATIDDAVEKMRGAGVRRLPIVSDEGRLLGMVSLDDLLVLLSAELADVSSVPIDNRGP